MCRKCLYLRDGDGGVDWQPVHLGVTNRKRTTLRRIGSPNWAALRGLDSYVSYDRQSRFADKEPIVYDPDAKYTDAELEQLSNQFLREAAKEVDPETGKPRGIGGENPILFDEHIYARRRREIYNENGVPDPSLVSGIYHRQHPNGRKVNTKEQRTKNGASYYRN